MAFRHESGAIELFLAEALSIHHLPDLFDPAQSLCQGGNNIVYDLRIKTVTLADDCNEFQADCFDFVTLMAAHEQQLLSVY